MLIRISQLRQRLDDWQLPLETVAARALKVKPQDILWARLARKSVDARDKGDVHFTLTLDVETARPVRLPKNAEEIPAREERARGGAPARQAEKPGNDNTYPSKTFAQKRGKEVFAADPRRASTRTLFLI